jgi:DNA-binding SARP family transcriptional activator
MSALRIQLFGKFSVQRNRQEIKDLAANKLKELLCYLLIHRARSHPRESLASVLWAETSTEKSKKYLRQALWQVQAAFDPEKSAMIPLLVVEHDWVYLTLHSEFWLDVDVFEHAYAITQDTPGAQLDKPTAELLKNGVAVYKGDLLDGWYQDWCLFERERLQNMYLAMLDKLMSYCEENSEYEAGRRYGAIILRYDRARERTYRQLMRLHYMAGDRTGALRQYERCVAALDEELDVRPDRRTTALYESIRNDGPDSPAPARAAAAHNILPDVLGRLKQLQITLASLHERVQRDVLEVERDLERHRKNFD